MKTGPIQKSPYWRYIHLRTVLKTIRKEAKASKATFSILCYGSASYGFNPANHGKLDDLDLFMIVPTGITVKGLLVSINRQFSKGLDLHESHIRHLLSGGCEMCRFYCSMDGVKVGFRVIPYHVLLGVSFRPGINGPLRNIARFGQSRIVTDNEWSFALKGYVPVVYENYSEVVGDEQVLTVVQRVISEGDSHLGAFGRKILAAHCVYEAPGLHTSHATARILEYFVQISLSWQPKLTNDQMIDSIMRAEKFSKSFRKRLSKDIDWFRA